MTRDVRDRFHQFVLELVPAGHERLEQSPIRGAVGSQASRGLSERSPNDRCGSIVERVRNRDGRLDQVELEPEGAEERRRGDEWVDSGADVVPESRQRQFRSTRSAADRLLRLDDADGASGLSERDRGREAVRPRPDDNGV
jgi:hypothetical protein